MSKPTQSTSASPARGEVVWLPSELFYVRRIALDAASDAASQTELALEAGAPFAAEQLYHGFLPASDNRSALVFATHRRIFSNDGWPGARIVLPGFVALLGEPPGPGRLRLWSDGKSLVAAAWDATGPLPALILARQNEAPARAELLAEVNRRLPGQKWEVDEFDGPIEVKAGRKGQGLELRLKARNSARTLVTALDPATLEQMDVRDKLVLATLRQTQRRDRILWGVFAAAVAVLALSLVLEGGLFAGAWLLKRQRVAQERVADEVRKIDTAQSLSARIEEMAQRQLRPFEMLAAINLSRPPLIQFTRCVTNGLNTLEIEAQTGSATSVGTFETALRGHTLLESVEIRDVRLRDGSTTFQLTAVFKPGAVAAVENGGPAP